MVGPPEAAPRGGAAARWVERYWAGGMGWRGRLLDLALTPAELTFRGVARLRGSAYDHGLLASTRAAVPVVSVGNIAVGGAGKTPVTRWVVAELQRRALRPAVLHGGYAADEPALHRRWNPQVPVIVGRDRIASARRAVEAGATALVLDDGFQHRRLARDLDLALVAAESWAPRPRLLPRGPWREPASALARAQVVVVTRKTASARAARELLMALRAFAPGAAAVQLWLRPAGWSRGVFFAGGNGGPGGRVSESGAAGSGSSTAPAASVSSGSGPQREAVAVTAIAHPALFVANAGEAGAQVAETLFFPDHHDYTDSDLEHIRQVAAGRPIVTTTKDLVKLGPLAPDLDLWVLEQEVVVEEGAAALSDLLDQISARARAR